MVEAVRVDNILPKRAGICINPTARVYSHGKLTAIERKGGVFRSLWDDDVGGRACALRVGIDLGNIRPVVMEI